MSVLTNEIVKVAFLTFMREQNPYKPGIWGKMNAHQMVEHLSDSIHQSMDNSERKMLTPVDKLPRLQAFLQSEKPFRENTINPTLPMEPLDYRNNSFEEALTELEQVMTEFKKLFENSKDFVSVHPIFGELNLSLWLRLHEKHFAHHARQFGFDH